MFIRQILRKLIELFLKIPGFSNIFRGFFNSRLDYFQKKRKKLKISTILELYKLHKIIYQDLEKKLSQVNERFERFIDSQFELRDNNEAHELNMALAAYERDKKLNRLVSYPSRFYLELTSSCNLRCRMCPQSFLDIPNTKIADKIVTKVAPILRFADLVSIVGFGEIFMNKNWRSILKQVSGGSAKIRIITNGILLHEDTARLLVSAGIDQVWVSIDAVDSETYLYVRGKDYFEQTLQNVKRLIEIRDSEGVNKPSVGLCFVAMKQNIEQLPEFIRMAKRMGADSVQVGYLIVYTEDMREQSLFYHKELANSILDEAKKTADELGIEVSLPQKFNSTGAKRIEQSLRFQCREPWEFIFIRNDGTIVPCCTCDTVMGDLKTDTFREIWNNNRYIYFRETIYTDACSPHCRLCVQEGYRDVDFIEHHVKLIDEKGKIASS